jgi:hypothetical protein
MPHGQAQSAKAKVVDAQQFLLRDQAGKTRASLELGKAGESALTFYDAGGKTGAAVGMDRNGSPYLTFQKQGLTKLALELDQGGHAHVTFYDGARARRLFLGLDDAGLPNCSLYDGQGNPGLAFFVARDGDPFVNLFHRKTRRLAVAVGDGGQPFLGVYDSKGRTRASLWVDEADNPVLALMDQGNARRVLLNIDERGHSHVNFYDASKARRLFLGEDNSGQPTLGVYDSKGQGRAFLGVDKADSPGLRLYDQSNIQRALLHVAGDGLPGLSLFNDAGVGRALLGVTRDGLAALTLHDKEDKGLAPAKIVVTAEVKKVGFVAVSTGKADFDESTFQLTLKDKAWLLGVQALDFSKPGSREAGKKRDEDLAKGGRFAIEGRLVLREHAKVKPSVDLSDEQRVGAPEGKALLLVIEAFTKLDDQNKALYPEPGQVRVQGRALDGQRDLKLVEEPTLAIGNGELPIVLDGDQARAEAAAKGPIQATGVLSVDKKGLLRLRAAAVKEVKE